MQNKQILLGLIASLIYLAQCEISERFTNPQVLRDVDECQGLEDNNYGISEAGFRWCPLIIPGYGQDFQDWILNHWRQRKPRQDLCNDDIINYEGIITFISQQLLFQQYYYFMIIIILFIFLYYRVQRQKMLLLFQARYCFHNAFTYSTLENSSNLPSWNLVSPESISIYCIQYIIYISFNRVNFIKCIFNILFFCVFFFVIKKALLPAE